MNSHWPLTKNPAFPPAWFDVMSHVSSAPRYPELPLLFWAHACHSLGRLVYVPFWVFGLFWTAYPTPLFSPAPCRPLP